MKFRPLHDRVVVRRIDADQKTAGGIIIPETAQEKPMQGEIVAVGPGSRDESGKVGAGLRCSFQLPPGYPGSAHAAFAGGMEPGLPDQYRW